MTYLLDNAAPQAPDRFHALAELYDAGTIRHLERCGIADGWRCLEVGAGGGSIARWLADSVSPSGRVVATDIDTRHLDALGDPRIDVRHHDVLERLPEGPFDLIHARLVLNALADRVAVLRRMVSVLAPAGWLLLEEFDSDSLPPDPTLDCGETYLTTHLALARFMADRGFDRRFGRRLFRQFRDCGLTEVAAEATMFMCPGGSPGAALIRANLEQLRDALIDAGYVTSSQFAEDIAALDCADFVMPSSILWSVRGRRSSTS